MKRIFSLLAVTALMVVMMAAMAVPALATPRQGNFGLLVAHEDVGGSATNAHDPCFRCEPDTPYTPLPPRLR